MDVTIIKLLDGTKAYLHAVIDNFSRRILAWQLAERLSPATTCEILQESDSNLDVVPTVVADSGVENMNGQVDGLVDTGVLRRVLAQVEVSFSNSMIEARDIGVAPRAWHLPSAHVRSAGATCDKNQEKY